MFCSLIFNLSSCIRETEHFVALGSLFWQGDCYKHISCGSGLGEEKRRDTHSLLGVVQMDRRCFRVEVAKVRDIEPQAAKKTCQKRMKTFLDAAL